MGISVISTKELAACLDACIVIDARTPEEYAASHIAGAINVCWEDWCAKSPGIAGLAIAQPGYWGVMADPAAESFARRLGALGISSNSHIVVYADGPRSKGRDGRVAWMLLYLGARHVALLDGGWRSWLAIDGDTSSPEESLPPATFDLELTTSRRTDLKTLKQACAQDNMPLMVDTRSYPEFDGLTYDYQPRKGRMPRSVLVEWINIFDSDELYLGKEEFLELFPVNVHKSPDVVFYCEVGVRAAHIALLYEAYSGRIVPVYDGSVMEWGIDPSLPVLTTGGASLALR